MGQNQPDAGLLRKKIRWGEIFIEKGIMGIAFLSIAFIVLIFIFVFREASPVFFSAHADRTPLEEVSGPETYGLDEDAAQLPQTLMPRENSERKNVPLWKNILGLEWQPVSLRPRFGITPIIVGTLKSSIIAILISAPVGVFAALFAAMFAPKWAKEFIKPIVEILAGFPSVVIGFFALMVLASIMQSIFHYQFRLNALVGGIALSIAVVPIVFTISEDALNAVPKSLVEASLALGAHTWETAIRVVLPAATPGIFAAVLLGVGRAIGETMIALMVMGNAALMSFNPVEPVRTMAATIGAEMAEVVFGDDHYVVLFFLGVVLFVFSFTLNVIAEVYIRQRLMKRFKGG